MGETDIAVSAAEEAARLAALNSLGVLDTPPEPELDVITALAADRLDCPIALISLVDDYRQWFKSRHGLDVTETPRSIAFCHHAIQSPEVMVVPDARADARFAKNPLVTGPPHIRFYAGAPLMSRSGHNIGTLCVLDHQPRHDLTARERRALTLMAAQAMDRLEMHQLRQSHRISHLIGETTSDAFVCTDADNRIIHWNRGAETLFGWPATEAIGQTLDLIVPDRHQKAHAHGVARMLLGGKSRLVGKTVEVPATRRQGDEITTELSLGMWPEEGKGTPQGFAAIIRDVSERKRLEEQRQADQLQLAEQMSAIEASNDGIAVTDPDGRYTFMNKAHAAIFGFTAAEEWLGQPWTMLYHPDEVARLEREAFPVLTAERRWRGQSIGRHRNGQPVMQEISLSLSSNGGIVCVTRDIGARLESEREKARLREQLLAAQRQEAVGQLASGIAHDFNNLIAVVAGSATLIQARGDAAMAAHADRIQKAANAAASLVAKMLALGTRQPDVAEVELGALVQGVADLVETSLSSRHRLHLQLPVAPLPAMADSTELMQVVLNLCLNARDAMPADADGEIRLRLVQLADASRAELAGPVVVGSLRAVPAAHIRVADNGSGISADIIERIFQPFFTDKGDRGSGLGLPVVAGIVAGVGGAVALASTPGQGSCFDIIWPLAAPDRSELLAAGVDDAHRY